MDNIPDLEQMQSQMLSTLRRICEQLGYSHEYREDLQGGSCPDESINFDFQDSILVIAPCDLNAAKKVNQLVTMMQTELQKLGYGTNMVIAQGTDPIDLAMDEAIVKAINPNGTDEHAELRELKARFGDNPADWARVLNYVHSSASPESYEQTKQWVISVARFIIAGEPDWLVALFLSCLDFEID